ncbi:MAG: hypothetical protein KGQ59_12035, partial [Bdellovibrionales bacterium]|nr:hypothetical protein [Bdellovibrionales bacterium]
MRSEPVVAVPVSQLNGCVHCGAHLSGDLAPHACGECGTPQPLIPGAVRDPFEVFQVSRRFGQSRSDLQKRFLLLSRALHPDRFARASEAARQASLERMGLVNEAFRILGDCDAIRDFLFSQSGFQEKSAQTAEDLELAERWFDLQEQLEEKGVDEGLSILALFHEELLGLLTEMKEQMQRLEHNFDHQDGPKEVLRDMFKVRHRINTSLSMIRDV